MSRIMEMQRLHKSVRHRRSLLNDIQALNPGTTVTLNQITAKEVPWLKAWKVHVDGDEL